MAITAIVTAPTQTISGNFNAIVTLDMSVTDMAKMSIGLTSLSGNGRTDVDFEILGSGGSYNLDFTLPQGETGAFDIAVVGQLTPQGESEAVDVTSGTARVTYDTVTSIVATIRQAIYSGREITIPIVFDDDVLYFSKTDCEIKTVVGDSIFDSEYFLLGSGRNYEVVIIIDPDRSGLFSVDVVGHVWKSSGVVREDVVSKARFVPFNTIEPTLTLYESLGELSPGIWDILLGFNIPVINVSVQDSFLYEGEYPSTPTLYRHEWFGDEAPDVAAMPLNPNSLPNCVGGWNLVPVLHSVVPSRYFLMRFNVPETRTGSFFVDLIPGQVKGYPS